MAVPKKSWKSRMYLDTWYDPSPSWKGEKVKSHLSLFHGLISKIERDLHLEPKQDGLAKIWYFFARYLEILLYFRIFSVSSTMMKMTNLLAWIPYSEFHESQASRAVVPRYTFHVGWFATLHKDLSLCSSSMEKIAQRPLPTSLIRMGNDTHTIGLGTLMYWLVYVRLE